MIWNFLLYMLYGLAFFTLGVAILSRDTRLSELGIAKILWLLALFGIVHGIHEWLELLVQLFPSLQSQAFLVLRLLVVSTSFMFLLYFGLFLNIITYYGDHAIQTTPTNLKITIGLLALGVLFSAIYSDFGSGSDLSIRRYIAFPGGLLSGLGLILYSRTVKPFSKKVALNFILAGAFMAIYSILTGIIPSDFVVPVINTKIILFRGASAFFIMVFTIRGLSVFSIEQRAIINDQLLRFSQSEKLTSMGILAAGIAHEINNPLTNASLNLEMLKDLIGESTQADKKIESIERNIRRASNIASELLLFSRDSESSFDPLDLNEVIQSAVNLLRLHALSSIITLKLQQIPLVMGLYHKLEEVFINVLMNSFDACSVDDYIEIETYADDKKVFVIITDTGHGLSSSKISQAFDPFFTTKEVGKGTGLGLSVCHNIIKQHQGDITMQSSTGGGTVVTIIFPMAGNNE